MAKPNKKEEEHLKNLEFEDKNETWKRSKVAEVMKGNNTDVALKDQTEEKVRIRAEYKGEELSMRIDTSKIDKCASDNFQNIELKVKKDNFLR